jgi:peptidoglycan/xylan/chitin deacetylase (PgdA/CDA1 family)
VKAILTYHSVDASRSVISIDPLTFRRHVAWLASGRVRVVPLAELPALPDDVDAVALTFDDGFRNFGEVAAPVLRDHGLTATVFVVSSAVGTTNAWRGTGDAGIPVLPLLDWHALGRLLEQGFDVGAHTRTHPRLTTLGPAAMEDEIAGSRADIAEWLGRVPATFAYPYGSFDDTTLACAARQFSIACTTELRVLGAAEHPQRLPRLDAYYLRASGLLEAWGTTRFSSWVRLRAGIRQVRELMAPPV